MNATTTVLRHWSERGVYDFTFDFAAVDLDGRIYLVIDHWCGGDVEGQCPRPHLYRVPEVLRQQTLESFHEGWGAAWDHYPLSCDHDYFTWEILPHLEWGHRLHSSNTAVADTIREALA
jgi:hypothetical protein